MIYYFFNFLENESLFLNSHSLQTRNYLLSNSSLIALLFSTSQFPVTTPTATGTTKRMGIDKQAKTPIPPKNADFLLIVSCLFHIMIQVPFLSSNLNSFRCKITSYS